MKKIIAIVICVVLCVAAVAGVAVIVNDGGFGSGKVSDKLTDGCWISWAEYMLDDVEQDGLGFVFKAYDKSSGIAVSLDSEEFPYVIKNGVIMMFRYDDDDEEYKLMFNAYIVEEHTQDGDMETLRLTPTNEGCSYVNEWPPEETEDISLNHIKGSSDNEFKIKRYFDFWSTISTDNELYSNGFSSGGVRYGDFRNALREQTGEVRLIEFYHRNVEFDDSWGDLRVIYPDDEDDRWVYTPGSTYPTDSSEGVIDFSFERNIELYGNSIGGDYTYDKSADAMIKNDGSGVTFYRVTSFADNDCVQQLSGERQTALLTAVAKAESDYTDWQAQYREYLEYRLEYIKNPDYASFSVGYVDDDDIPELFLSEDSSHVSQVEVFTLRNGIMKSLGEYGSSGMLSYIERDGMICSQGMWQGNSSYAAYELNGGTLTEVWNGSDNQGSAYDESVLSFHSNGEQVSRNEYEDMLDKYFAEDKLKTHGGSNGVDYNLTYENIRNVIGRVVVSDSDTDVKAGAESIEDIEKAVEDLFNGNLDYQTYQNQYCLPNRDAFYESFCNIVYDEYYAEEGWPLDEVREEFEELDGIGFYYEWLNEKTLESVSVGDAEKISDDNDELVLCIKTAFEKTYPTVEIYEFYNIHFMIEYVEDESFYWTNIIVARTENGFVIIGDR